MKNNRFVLLIILTVLVYPISILFAADLYRDQQNHFYIELPSRWTIKQPKEPSTVLKAVEGNGGNINISIMAVDSDVTSDYISKEWVDEMYAIMKKQYPDARLIDSGISSIDNNKAAYIVFSYSYRLLDVIVPITMMVYSTIEDKKVVTITCGGHRDKFSYYEPICKRSIASFVFERSTYR